MGCEKNASSEKHIAAWSAEQRYMPGKAQEQKIEF